MRFREILENAWDWSKEEMEDMIRTSAKKNGIDPDIAVRVWKSEGGMNKQSNVDRDGKGSYNGKEDSWGPFQMYLGGGMGNAYVKKYHDGNPDGLRRESSKEEVQRQIDFALNQATKLGWGPWMGASAIGITGYDGIKTRIDPDTVGKLQGEPVDWSHTLDPLVKSIVDNPDTTYVWGKKPPQGVDYKPPVLPYMGTTARGTDAGPNYSSEPDQSTVLGWPDSLEEPKYDPEPYPKLSKSPKYDPDSGRGFKLGNIDGTKQKKKVTYTGGKNPAIDPDYRYQPYPGMKP